MHIAILTFDGYNELDSLIALGVLNRSRPEGWRVSIASPTPTVTSMNGVTVHAHVDLAEACTADAVIVGSGMKTREIIQDADIMTQLKALDPARQLIGAQCSGALILATLGLLNNIPPAPTPPPNLGSSKRALMCSTKLFLHRATSPQQAAALHQLIWAHGCDCV